MLKELIHVLRRYIMAKYRGIYWQQNEVSNFDAVECLAKIDYLIDKIKHIKTSDSRELSLAVTKLQEAQLWLTQISG